MVRPTQTKLADVPPVLNVRSNLTALAALDIADRQSAHSMTMAVRGIVELFRLVKREKEQ
jgi:hypothetical protein